MKYFDLDQGVDDMRDSDLGQVAIGSDLVKKLCAPTRLEELPTWSRSISAKPG